MVTFQNDWDALLGPEFQKEYYLRLREFLKKEYAGQAVYPPMQDIFSAFRYTPYGGTKALILGQDPYHQPGQAHGLCFSVRAGVPLPPSLQNIFKELRDDAGVLPPPSGELTAWAKEGVLLLNTTLTVRQGQPMSHAGQGWEILTDHVIRLLDQSSQPVVFLLWGSHARAKKALVQNPRHLVLEAVHPSPLSAYQGFFGCRHFSKTNDFLRESGREPINWHALHECP
ncbi:MAG: uracil-DNA glycosylase [Eubacteriales bacterium]